MTWELVMGVDEVGRGCLAGPLYAAAACFAAPLSGSCPIQGVKDSKAFTDKTKMWAVHRAILRHPTIVGAGLGIVTVHEINNIGIDKANALAFKRAVAEARACLGGRPHRLIVDGDNPVEGIPYREQTVKPKADALHWQVSAASIIAKILRDEEMAGLDRIYPGYHWAQNAGYGTKDHQEALKRLGPTAQHRLKFIRRIIHGDGTSAVQDDHRHLESEQSRREV